jgi:predicted dehydrogenase
MSISLGLVGLGSFGSAFAELFHAHPLVGRVALCDREPDRIARFADRPSWGAKLDRAACSTQFDDLLASDLDALIVITQPWLHAPQCLAALEHGKHVYSAVPITSIPDADEILDWCDQLVRAVERTGLHYMLGETTIYRPITMYCKRRAAEGAFGDFVFAEGHYYHPFDSRGCDLREVERLRTASTIGQEWPQILDTYRQRGIVGGPMTYPTHSTSGPIHVMGGVPAQRVSCFGNGPFTDDGYFPRTNQGYSNETALFQMANGCTMRICEHREIVNDDDEGFRLYGTEGSFEHDAWLTKDGRTPLTVDDMRAPLPDDVAAAFRAASGESFYGGHGGSHAYLVHEFVDAIAHDRLPTIHIWEAVRYMAAGAVAHQSALRDGETLEVPDWGDPPALAN